VLVFLYRVYYAFAVPTRLTVYRNLRTQYGLYTDNFPSLYTLENPIATNPTSLLTSHTTNISYSGLVSKAREQGLVA
jgi:hypothetical protein